MMTTRVTDLSSVSSVADLRFRGCRWAKNGGEAYCSNPHVLPFAGTHGFAVAAWCSDCAFYKVKKSIKVHRAPAQASHETILDRD